MLERGNAEGAARELAAASEIAARQGATRRTAGEGAGAGGGRRTAGLREGQLAWVLGLLERHRGRPAGAERAWSRALELLDGESRGSRRPVDRVGRRGGAARPTALLLRARLLLELGGLHVAAGGQETARNLLGRALTALSRLSDPEALSRACLLGPLGQGRAGFVAQTGGYEADGAGGEESAAGALAAFAVARRLAEQGQRELARLDRPALRRAAGRPQEVPHSRHLR